MSPRQKEFCRHYAAGLPAPAAAVAAGYARSTAERNAASFLDHPQIAARIAALRARRNIVTLEDLREAKDKVMTLLRCGESADQLRAAEQLCRLAKMQARLEAEQQDKLMDEILLQDSRLSDLQQALELKAELEELSRQQGAPEAAGASSQQAHLATLRLHEINIYLLEQEGLVPDEKYLEAPPHFDRLPSGEIAFDAPAPYRPPRKAKEIREAYRQQTMKRLQKES